MRLCHPLRHVGEEGLQRRVDAKPGIGLPHLFDILRAALLGDVQTVAQGRGQLPQHLRHKFGEETRPLRTAEHEQLERAGFAGWRIGRGGHIQHRFANWIAGENHLALQGRRQIDDFRKRRGDHVHALRHRPVGAAHDGVLLVNGRGNAHARGGQQRRERRIAAEADDGGRTVPPQPEPRLGHPLEQPEKLERQFPGLAEGQSGGGYLHDVHGREAVTVFAPPGIGEEHHDEAAPHQFLGQRLGGKEMPARAARGQRDQAPVLSMQFEIHFHAP